MKRQVLSLLRPLPLPPRVYQHLHFQGDFSIQVGDRQLLMRHHGCQIENELFWEGLPGRRERVSMQLWMKLATRADVVFDVGANTGVYALVAKSVQPNAQVLAFEPVPSIAEKLRANCRMNAFDVEVQQVAISNEDGTGSLHLPPSEVPLAASMAESVKTWDRIDVATRRLDTVIRERRLDRLDLVKLDVEGWEPQALEGLGSYLATYRPDLLIEILSIEAARRVEDLLRGLEYVYLDIDEKNSPRRVDRLDKSSHWNYLVCRPESLAWLDTAR
jgi:FkbM family methyltransferase